MIAKIPFNAYCASLALAVAVAAAPIVAEAGRLAGHGGGGGGGARAHSSVHQARSASRPNVQRQRPNVQRPSNPKHSSPLINSKPDKNINISNNNVNINGGHNNWNNAHHDDHYDHHDDHHHHHNDWDIDYHPIATAAIVTGTVLAIGSIVNSIPPDCSQVYRNGTEYYYCNNQYYQPQWQGDNVVYVVVNNP